MGAAVSAQGYCTTRGSPDIYACAQTSAGFVQGFDKATNKFTVDASIAAADDDTIFVNGLGPMRITSGGATGTDVIASYAGEAGDEFFESFSGTTDTGMLVFGAAAYTDRAAGDILIMDGRRYKVASVGTTPDTTAAKVTLTESYAGGMIYEECTGCVTAIAATALTVSRSVTVAVGEGFMVQGYTDINQVFTAKSANTPGDLGVNGLTITLNKGAMNGYPLEHAGAGASSTGVCKCFKGYSNDNCDTQNMLAA